MWGSRTLARILSSVFAVLGRLRRAPAFHPVGAAYRARLAVEDTSLAPALDRGSYASVVRLSRGIGWPMPLPDVHGVGIRVPDHLGPGRHQDLLVSTVPTPIALRALPWLRRSVTAPLYSTIAPYRTPTGTVMIGLRPLGNLTATLEELDAFVQSGQCRWEVLVAAPRAPWRHLGTLAVAPGRLDRDEELGLGLDPWNTHPELRPAGWLNELRRPAYPASRRGRRADRHRVESSGHTGDLRP